jgi:hypothetical protein
MSRRYSACLSLIFCRVTVEQSQTALNDGVEHRLGVGQGAGDRAQDVGCGCLLVERCRQRTVLALQLREQPHVLDGDHRLIGEGLEQFDLTLSEGSGRVLDTEIAPMTVPSRSIGMLSTPRSPAAV